MIIFFIYKFLLEWSSRFISLYWIKHYSYPSAQTDKTYGVGLLNFVS